MVLKIETFLTSQNLTKDRDLLVVCSEVQKCGVVKTYLGIVTHMIFFKFWPNFKKLSLIQGMAQKVLRVCVDIGSVSLPHSIEIPTLPPPHP